MVSAEIIRLSMNEQRLCESMPIAVRSHAGLPCAGGVPRDLDDAYRDDVVVTSSLIHTRYVC